MNFSLFPIWNWLPFQIVNNDNFSTFGRKENWERKENWNWQQERSRGWDFDKSIKSLLFSQTNKHAFPSQGRGIKKEMHLPFLKAEKGFSKWQFSKILIEFYFEKADSQTLIEWNVQLICKWEGRLISQAVPLMCSHATYQTSSLEIITLDIHQKSLIVFISLW